jgi:hypothetical protein
MNADQRSISPGKRRKRLSLVFGHTFRAATTTLAPRRLRRDQRRILDEADRLKKAREVRWAESEEFEVGFEILRMGRSKRGEMLDQRWKERARV